MVAFNQRSDLDKTTLKRDQQSDINLLEFRWLRDLPKPLVNHRGGPVHQIPPPRNQFIVGATQELFPCEVGVRRFRTRSTNEVAQRIGLVPLQHVANVDDDPA